MALFKKANSKLTIMYVLALATNLVRNDVDRDLEHEECREEWKLETRLGLRKILSCVKDARTALRKANAAYERFIEPEKDRCIHSAEVYDGVSSDGNETVQLLMLYWDRCYRNIDNVYKIFAYIRSLPSSGMFDEEDINHFKLKRYDGQ